MLSFNVQVVYTSVLEEGFNVIDIFDDMFSDSNLSYRSELLTTLGYTINTLLLSSND